MERKELEVFSELVNNAIVRIPGRNFPGCVIQGNTVASLLHIAQDLQVRAKLVGDSELIELSDQIVDSLAERLKHYEEVMTAHQLQLPYTKT